MTRHMFPPAPLPRDIMTVHTKLVRTAAASIRAMASHTDQYQSLLERTRHDSDLEQSEVSRRTKILDEERKKLATKPYEDVRPYVMLMFSIVKQYSNSSLTHTRVRALHSIAATKVILRSIIPRLGSARDRVLQDIKSLLYQTASVNTLLVLPGRNAFILLTRPESASNPWSGQSMSVQDYNAAVSELESWTFPQRRIAAATIAQPTSTFSPIERERRPYGDSSSSNGIERQRRPYQAYGTGEFTDSEPLPSTRLNVGTPRTTPSASSESQPSEPEIVQQQYGSQFIQTSHLPRRTQTRSRVPPLPAENPLPRPPQFQPEQLPSNELFNQIFGQTPRGAPSSTPQDRPPSPTEVLSPQIAEQARQRVANPYIPSELNVPSSPPPQRPRPSQPSEPMHNTPPFNPRSAQRRRPPDDPVNSIFSPQIVEEAHQRVADPYMRSEPTLNVPLTTPSPPQRPRSSQPSEPTLNRARFTAQRPRPSQPQPDPAEAPPPCRPSSQPQPAFLPEQLGSERAFHAGDHDASSIDLIATFEANPLSLIHTRDPNNPISFSFAESAMRWLVEALDIEILAPAYLPTGSATVIIDYTAAAMGALLQSSDLVDGDIMTSCYRFSEDPVGWFRESQAMEFVQPEWGREWEKYWVWGILYREGDVKVRVKRKVDVEEVRAWLGGSRVWTEG